MCGSWGVGPPRWEPQAWLPLGAYHASLGLCTDRDPPSLPALSLTPWRMEPGPSSRLQPSKLLTSGNCPQASPCARAGVRAVVEWDVCGGHPLGHPGAVLCGHNTLPGDLDQLLGPRGRALGLAWPVPTARDGARRPPASLSLLTPTVQIRHKPTPWAGAAGSSGDHKPPAPPDWGHRQGLPGQGSPRWLR